MITLLAYAGGVALLPALIHLFVVLIVIAIIYYLGDWVGRKLAAPELVLKLWLILCALIALYHLIVFLMSLAP